MLTWGIVSESQYCARTVPTEFLIGNFAVLSMAFVKSFVGLLMYALLG